MLSYDSAVSKVLETVWPLAPQEQALADLCCRQILAETVSAQVDLPPADTAAMDGFALALPAAPQEFDIVGRTYAGQLPFPRVEHRQTVRIATGAQIPPGCDTVVPLEKTAQAGENRISLLEIPERGAHIRYRGEEFRAGDEILAAGTTLNPGAIGLLAAAGVSRLKVYPKPRVAVLSTGDELLDLEQPPSAGKIVNSNLYMLASRLREAGIAPLLLGISEDSPAALNDNLHRGLNADLLITSGGTSVGDRDLIQPALKKLGFSTIFRRVAISPGRPILFGTIGDLPVFGLPGTPIAAATTYELFVHVALRRLAGFCNPLPTRLKTTLATPVEGGNRYQRFLRGRLRVISGSIRFFPAPRQKGRQMHDLPHADALLPVAPDSPGLTAGSLVEVLLIRFPDSRANN